MRKKKGKNGNEVLLNECWRFFGKKREKCCEDK